MTEIVHVVTNSVRELENIKNIYEVIACGSYRRGKSTCGDVDVLLCRKDGVLDFSFLPKLIDYLTKNKKILVDHL